MVSAEIGKRRRIGRIIKNGKMLVVPIDDSLIFGPYDGLYNLEQTVGLIETATPSAILAYRGSISLLHSCSIPIILNVTASTTTGDHVHKVLTNTVEDAIKIDADCVAAHVNFANEKENEMLKQLSAVITKADSFGIPVLAISYPRKSVEGKDYNYLDLDEESYTKLICHATRTVAELGADIIKTQYTGSAESFEKVVNSALGRPVIIAGGPLKQVDEAYLMAKNVIDAGGAGISYGRNVFNAHNIPAFLAGLREIVFESADISRALKIYRGYCNV